MSHIPSDSASHSLKALHDIASAISDEFGGTDFLAIDGSSAPVNFFVAFLCHSPPAFNFPNESENLDLALISPLAGVLRNFSISCYHIVRCSFGN